jgi:Ca-activated chloride channel family protein
MYHRKINPLLLLFSVIGGTAGFLTGEAVLAWGEGSVPNVLLIGMYFGQLALWVGLLCLLAEFISPELNGKGWRLRYARDGWKLLIPATFVLLCIAGIGLQFIYGLYFGKHQPPQDILMAIDISESMTKTDPSRESFKAAKQLVHRLEPDKRTAIITFNNEASILQPLTSVNEQSMKDGVIAKLDSFGPPTGGTDIGAALQKSMEQVDAAKGDQRKSMVILISDGYSNVDLEQALAPYKSNQIAINTVGMNEADEQGNDLLKQIATKTGGTFHKAGDVQKLTSVIAKIYKSNQSWHLVGDRTGASVNSLYYTILRIVCILLIGTLMGLSLGTVFDNRFLAKSFSIGGAVAGLLAGIILEFGLKSSTLSPFACRAFADVVLAIVLSLATAVIAYKRGSSTDPDSGLYSRNRKSGAQGFGRQQGTHRDFQ